MYISVLEWDGYRDQIVTMLHSVMWVCLCIPGHIHCSCSTVMALLCIPLSELVSFAFSTIPICPFLIQRHLLVHIGIVEKVQEKQALGYWYT